MGQAWQAAAKPVHNIVEVRVRTAARESLSEHQVGSFPWHSFSALPILASRSQFKALVESRRDQPLDLQDAVRAIVRAVQEKGDAALIEFTARFDRTDLGKTGLRIPPEELKRAYEGLSQELRGALALASERIEKHHRRQLPRDERYVDGIGAELGHRWTPLDSVGLYVPGGKASYPSSVLMNAIPARSRACRASSWWCQRRGGEVNPAVLAAAHLAGISEVYRIGGAQAVAALAYGTETIEPVAKIVGPGNAYVAEAKRQVFGTVGIDTIAGPSEVVVVADKGANPQWIAADLLAQAEHDEAAQSILIADNEALAGATALALEDQIAVDVAWRNRRQELDGLRRDHPGFEPAGGGAGPRQRLGAGAFGTGLR